MSQKTTTNAKKVDSKLQSLNLKQFANQLSSYEVKEKSKKSTIYLYPNAFTDKEINNEVGKNFRSKLRNEIKRFANNIFAFTKQDRPDELIAEINKFKSFYKTNYKVNDFSLQSISQSKGENNVKDISFMLDIIKKISSTDVKKVVIKKEKKIKNSSAEKIVKAITENKEENK